MKFHWLAGLRTRCLSHLTRSRGRRLRVASHAPALVQPYEPRLLLSASPAGSEFQVNTFTSGTQYLPDIAMDADGDFVAVWTSDGQDGSGFAIVGQRYDSAGTAVGDEFLVNTVTTSNQFRPVVAMDADGDFVVVWDYSGNGIFGQRYNAQGVKQGTEFEIGSSSVSTGGFPDVAMDADGDFVVAWHQISIDGDQEGIVAQRFNAAGVAQGSEFQVNTVTTDIQIYAKVAMDAVGDFVIVWSGYGNNDNDYGIYAQRYDAAGVAQGSEFQVNTVTTGEQGAPVIAMDAAGNFVIAWDGPDDDSSGVSAQRFDASGTALGSEFQVNTTTTNTQNSPNIALDADGDFTIVWSSFSQDGSLGGIFGQQFNDAGAMVGSEFQVNTFTTNSQLYPAIAMDADGDFVVAWASDLQDGSDFGVFAQRYAEAGPDAADDAGPIVTDVIANGTPIYENDRLASAPDTLTVIFSEDLSVTGGVTGANSVTNPANWSLTQDGNDVSSLIQSISFGENITTGKFEAVLTFSGALADGAYVLTANGTSSITDLAGNALDGDVNGTPGGDFTRTFTVQTPVFSGPEFQVNTYTNNYQGLASVAMDTDGNYVIAWQSNGQDGSLYGIYAQRYNAAGVAQGSEFLVNTVTANRQNKPSVAMDADGDFVIAWQSYTQDGSDYGIYAQRYNAAGVAQGSEFQVNTYTTSSQSTPSVAMDANGDFVITWQSYAQDGSGYGIFAQRYNAAGVAQGSEFQVNTFTNNPQNAPSVAMDADGDFVIAWQSFGPDGSGLGISAQRYNAWGVAQGSEFQVNTYTTIYQYDPSVAMDADGDFVIAWQSGGQDGSEYGIYAQRYNALGVTQGTEFQVNTHTTSQQNGPSVAMDADGDFVIVWESYLQDGSDFGIYAQRYNAAGIAQDTEFRINSYTTNRQFQSSVAMDADGDFVVAWESNLQDGSSYGIYAQRYFTNTAPVFADQTLAIDEAAAVGTVVGTPLATDPDSFNTLTYNFTGGNVNKAFDINPNTGEITVRRAFALDFETLASFTLRVQATDNLGAFKKANITVNLNDVNDTPSISPLSFYVTPAAANGTVVGNAMATDQDSGDTITYAITGGNVGKAFAVDAMTGDITLAKASALDPMTLPVYSLTIQATDSHGAFRKAVMSINVSNQKPSISPQTFSIVENAANNSVVANIVASDVDAGDSLTYAITGGNVNKAFDINATTGQITVRRAYAIDFETLPTFNVTVQATDLSGAFRKAVMTINVTDVNEQPDVSPQVFNVDENSTNGTVVGTVIASDPDAGNTLTYAITGGNVSSAFAINSLTGEITVTNSTALDFETRPTFSLTVQVTDNQGSSRKAVMTINLNNVAELNASLLADEDDDLFSTMPSLMSFTL